MSLRIWLPLNGNLDNKGLDGNIISLIGSPTYNDGKLGKSLSISTNGNGVNIENYMSIMSGFLNYSIMAWVYLDDVADGHSSSIISSGNWNQPNGQCTFGLNSYADGYGKILCPNTSGWANGISLNEKIQLNNWYHIAIVYDGIKTKGYVNGINVGEYNGGGICQAPENVNLYIGSATYYSGFTLKGKINDVRIYDHALSLKEVQEISKGLILHYPLNNTLAVANPNLFNTATAISVPNNGSTTAIENGVKTNGLNVDTYFNVMLNTTLTANTTYTVSCWCKGMKEDDALRFGLHTQNSGFELIVQNGFNSVTFTPSTDIDTKLLFDDRVRTNLPKVELTYFKLEEGSVATAWIPSVNDSRYSSLSLEANSNVADCSGNGNDGTINNVTYSSDSKKYNSSAVFNGTNSYIKVTDNNWMPQYTDELTVSCWAYSDDWSTITNGGRIWSCIETGGFNIEGGASGYWRFPVYCATNADHTTHAYKYNNSGLKISDLTAGWHMITWVFTLSNHDIFLDGELYNSSTQTNYGLRFNTNARLFLGCEANTASPYSPYFNGRLSDFRIYATALSADQILELYQTTSSIDKNNNFYSYSYNELNQGNEIEYLHDLTKSNSGTFTQDKDGLHLDQYVWVTHDYIPIDPTNKTYKYDIIYSNDAGNLLYIGWERYDVDKTSRSNNACVYVLASSAERNYYRIRGTVDLSTDTVNPCAFIKLRILNKWTGSDSETNGTATIHYLSLKEYSDTTTQDMTPLNINKQGIVNTTEILEKDIGVSVSNVYELNSHNFYEY